MDNSHLNLQKESNNISEVILASEKVTLPKKPKDNIFLLFFLRLLSHSFDLIFSFVLFLIIGLIYFGDWLFFLKNFGEFIAILSFEYDEYLIANEPVFNSFNEVFISIMKIFIISQRLYYLITEGIFERSLGKKVFKLRYSVYEFENVLKKNAVYIILYTIIYYSVIVAIKLFGIENIEYYMIILLINVIFFIPFIINGSMLYERYINVTVIRNV